MSVDVVISCFLCFCLHEIAARFGMFCLAISYYGVGFYLGFVVEKGTLSLYFSYFREN